MQLIFDGTNWLQVGKVFANAEKLHMLWYNKVMNKQVATQQTFKILVERDEDGYFVASVPALPGCHTQAKSFPELMKRAKEAILLCLLVAKDDPQYQAQIEQFAYEPSFVGMELVSI